MPNLQRKFQIIVFTFALLDLVPYDVVGQSGKFVSGYVVTLKGDTVRGLLRTFWEPGKPSDVCLFKSQPEGDLITYRPDQLRGFYLTGKGPAISKRIVLNGDSVSSFMVPLANGSANLFRLFRSTSESVFFVQTKDSPLEQLTNETIVVQINGSPVHQKSNRFRAQLDKIMSDCSSLKKKIDHAVLQEKRLVLIVEEFNKCKGDAPAENQPKPEWTVRNWGISALISSSKFLPTNLDGSSTQSTSGGSSVSYMAGPFMEWTFSRRNRGQSVRADLLYVSHYFTSSYYYSSTFFEDGITELTQLKLPVSYKKSFGHGKLSPYLLLGLSLTFNLQANTKRTVTNAIGSSVYENNYSFTSNPLGFFGGVGVMMPLSETVKGFIEFRAEKAPEITNVSLAVGVRF